MEVSKYIMLFHKKMKGDINSQEQKELSDWLQQEDSRGLAEGLEKAWGLSQRYKENYEPDVDAGLARLQQRIASAREGGNRVGVRALPPRRRAFPWFSAAAAIALLAAIGWWWAGNGNAADQNNALFYTAGAGESVEAVLPDGSVVMLNENSFLSVDADLTNTSERHVELTGEAYFKVEPHPSRPFIITTRYAEVQVLGTAFNLRAYPEEGFTEVEVEEGSVRLSELSNGDAIELSSGQRGVCRPGAPLNAKTSPGLNAHSWRTRRLNFRDVPLGEVLHAIERHYSVELTLQNPEIRNCGVTTSFQEASLGEVLQTLSLIFSLEAEPVNGRSAGFLLKGGRCRPADSVH